MIDEKREEPSEKLEEIRESRELSRKRRLLFSAMVLFAFAAVLLLYTVFYNKAQFHFTTVEADPAAGKTTAAVSAERSPSSAKGLPEPKSIDLNRAGKADLQRLPSVGPTLAERIIEYRRDIGGFVDIEELQEVDGIGEKVFAALQDYIFVE